MYVPLDRDTFNLWREEHDKKTDLILAHVEQQTELNLATQGRLTTIETQQKEASAAFATRTTWISSVIAAIVGGLTSWVVTK
jgi:hypothetical protein